MLGIYFDCDMEMWAAHWLGDPDRPIAYGDTPEKAVEIARLQINKHGLKPQC